MSKYTVISDASAWRAWRYCYMLSPWPFECQRPCLADKFLRLLSLLALLPEGRMSIKIDIGNHRQQTSFVPCVKARATQAGHPWQPTGGGTWNRTMNSGMQVSRTASRHPSDTSWNPRL